jgi:hypothetical protein
MSVWQISGQGKLAARLHESWLVTHEESEHPSVGNHWAKEIDCLDLVAITGGTTLRGRRVPAPPVIESAREISPDKLEHLWLPHSALWRRTSAVRGSRDR